MSVLIAVLVVGGVWTLVDALRRGADPLWIAALVLLFPFSWPLYWLVARANGAPRLLRPRGSEPVAAEVEPAASLSRRRDQERQVALADTLEAQNRAADAEPIYRAVLAEDPGDLAAWHGLARALLSLARPGEAVDALERVLVRDRAFRRYAAALDFAEALWQNGQRQDAIEVLESLARLTGRVNHQVALAHYLTLDGRREAARAVLERLLADHHDALREPRQREWAARAVAMLEGLRG